MALGLTACTATSLDGNVPVQPPPERIQLHYDFSSDWMATAGDQCAERLNLSEAVFLSIGTSSQETAKRYHVADFFLLEPDEPAQAVVGTADGDGRLALAIETEGVADGRRVAIIYAMLLEPEGAFAIRLRAFTMTVRGADGRATETDLLAQAAADPTIPILSAAGGEGLCLKRI